MSVPLSTPTAAQAGRVETRPRSAVAAALTAAALLVGNGVVGLLADVDDHLSGAGLASEMTAGLAFLAGAASLVLLRPVVGWRALLWWLAPAGMGVAGVTMVGVPVVGSEPAEWLFVLAVLPTFVGMVAAGVLGTGRVWPWWTGAGVALFLPVMFALPYNSFVMGLIWLSVARAAQRPGARAATR